MSFPQIPLIALISIVVGGGLFLFMIYFAMVSWHEEEKRTTIRALVLGLLLPVPYLVCGIIDFELREVFCYILLGITTLLTTLLLLPIGNSFEQEDDNPKTRFDERDTMFSRKQLKEGSDRFNTYYKQHPQLKTLDDQFRSHPGLLQKGALFHEPVTAAAADASFKTVAAFHKILDDETLPDSTQKIDSDNMTHFIKTWLKKLGAVSVGVTGLRDYHMYSTIGRGQEYGKEVSINHKYAIAFTVKMDKYLLDRAPKGPTVMESAQQYLTSGTFAVQLAEFIRQLGFSSRAHIDGSYRVICPLVARDAGLGEIGRMGLLMTTELGPRVRIAAVTTDLPLIVDNRKQDYTMIDFCRQCKKCADVCPAKAISFEERKEIDGAIRWKINSEACFTFWCKVGTDCARCMSVCPYSHPNNALHNMVRFGVKQSTLFRKFALKMDDFFYGRIPVSLEIPSWMDKIITEEKSGNN